MENKEQLRHIISGCLQNKRRSQEELFKLYYGKMLSVCMRYTADRDSAEEVLQEGFIKIFDKLEAFDYDVSSGEESGDRLLQNPDKDKHLNNTQKTSNGFKRQKTKTKKNMEEAVMT